LTAETPRQSVRSSAGTF